MTTVGGQAVLEGVMMRGPSNWAVAVRKPDGDIAHATQPIRSPMARNWIFRLPVVRGVIALGESLAIGFRALAISANYAAQEEKEGETLEEGEPPTELTRAQLIFAFAIAIGFAVLLFKVSPALRHRLPALGDGDRDLRVRVLRTARVVLADRNAHPPPAGDRGDRLRTDPLRGQAHRQPRADDR